MLSRVDILAALAAQLLQYIQAEEAEEVLQAPPPSPAARQPLADKGWFSLEEATAWTGFGRKWLRRKMAERRLWFQRYNGREIRIPKAHLDDQMARGFPVLNLPPTPYEAAEIAQARPITRLIPGPVTPVDPNPPRVK